MQFAGKIQDRLPISKLNSQQVGLQTTWHLMS